MSNAGIDECSLAKDTRIEVDRRIMEVDFFGPVALTKRVLPWMIEQKSGHRIVTSSVALARLTYRGSTPPPVITPAPVSVVLLLTAVAGLWRVAPKYAPPRSP